MAVERLTPRGWGGCVGRSSLPPLPATLARMARLTPGGGLILDARHTEPARIADTEGECERTLCDDALPYPIVRWSSALMAALVAGTALDAAGPGFG
jgi:hypothetical protein